MKRLKLGFLMHIIFDQPKKLWIPYSIGIVVMLILGYFLVYFTGGTQYGYLHILYLPIVLSGIMFGVKGGVIVAFIAGVFVLGFLMPLDTDTGQVQPWLSWVLRLFYFVLMGFLIGVVFDRFRRMYTSIQDLYTHSLDTGLPNYYNYLSQYEEGGVDEADYSLTVLINNYEDLIMLIGRNEYISVVRDIYSELKRFLPGALIYQIDNRMFWLEVNHKAYKDQFESMLAHFDHKLFMDKQYPVFVDISIGVYLSEQTTTRLNAFKASETAAFYAKKQHLKYAVYEEDFSISQRNLERLGALPLAIQNNDLFLEYQPIIDYKTERVVTVEALIRWNLNGDTIPPLDFIPLAEETNIIDQITEWIVNQVLIDYPSLAKDYPVMVNINISQRNLTNPELIESLLTRLSKENLGNVKLGFEVTETTVMLDMSLAKQMLTRFNKKKIMTIIDDFGTGYSSLSSLNQIPVDIIKIDRDFVNRLKDDKSIIRLFKLIIDYAHDLNIKVVAEGIETKEYESVFKDLGCDYGQGFYYAKPLKLKKAVEWIKQHNETSN